jgi:filamentous hemagglutinin family protein
MKYIQGIVSGLLLLVSAIAHTLPSHAQVPITAAPDGTNTLVNQSGSRFDITGGTRAGANLFHSFQQFGLSQGQMANFLSNPAIQNILGRVTGGNSSVINGLIQVTGGSSNLYLMNPAGIIFGAGASLNVPGSFVATTANGIGLGCGGSDGGCGGWFNAAGTNNYAALSGTPHAVAFTMRQPGAIVNAGNLAVGQGQNLVLLGGMVVNTGTLAASGGQVAIAAVPGERLVRVSQPGELLSLEMRPLPLSGATPQPFHQPIPSLPELLTGGNGGNATGIVVHADGAISLAGSGLRITPAAGTTVASGQVNVSTGSPGQVGGTVQVLGDRVAVVNARLNASGSGGGGTILVGGDYRGQGTLPNAQLTYISPGSTIQADATQQGHGGRVIVWADHTTDFRGTITARGGARGGNGGFAEVSGKRTLNYRGTADLRSPQGTPGTLLLDPENILIRSGTGDGDDNGIATDAFGNNAPGNNGQVTGGDPAPSIIYQSELEGMGAVANILLEATNHITIEPLTGGRLEIPALLGGDETNRGSITFRADADANGTGNFSMNPTDTIRTNDRDIRIFGASITTGNINTVGPLLVNGSVEIVGNNINTGRISAGGGFGNTSSVRLTATTGDVIVRTISAGGGGIDIDAARYFRATDSFPNFLRLVLDPVEDADLIQFLSRGNPQSLVDQGLVDGVRQVFVNLPTSLAASPDSGPAPIRIRHGGELRTLSSGQVQIEGTGSIPEAQFVVGPNNDHTITVFDPGSNPAGSFDNFSTLFPAGAFPETLSGATGAIVRGQGDATLVTSLQNRPFDPSRIPTGTGTGGTGGTAGGGAVGGGEVGSTTGAGVSGPGNRGATVAQFESNVDTQAVQRQLENQTSTSACPPTSANATSRRASRSASGSPAIVDDPCNPVDDDAQILQILEASPDPASP